MLDNYGSDSTADLLVERGQTHGDFTDHARITQRLKMIVGSEMDNRARRQQPDLSHAAIEALSMITHKIGRILAGKWDHADHWDDIAGYARLVADRCREASAQSTQVDHPTHRAGMTEQVEAAWNQHHDPGDETTKS
jgi:hypothetical protein